MNYKSHLTGGITIGIAGIFLSHNVNLNIDYLCLIGGSIIGCFIPDIDHPQSYLGRRVPLIPTLLYKTVGHRSLTHSLFFSFIMGIIVAIFDIGLGIGIFLGILSHIFLDMFTPQGVSYLYPFNKKRIRWFRF